MLPVSNDSARSIQILTHRIDPAVAALNLAQTQVGKLSANGCSFVIDPALGELEFEADENELTLKVADINGEWGIFIPQAGAVAAAATGEATEEEVLVNGTFGTPTAVTGGNVKTDILFPGNVSCSPFPRAFDSLHTLNSKLTCQFF